MRFLTKLIINNLLFIAIGFSYTHTLLANTEPTESERTFVQSTIISTIVHSDYYQNTRKNCQALAEEGINPSYCEELTLENIDLDFKTGHLSKNNNDIIAIALFHLEGNIENIKKHLFVFLRQDDNALKLLDTIALPGFVHGIEDFTIENSVIVVHALELDEQDERWSPTIHKTLHYGIEDEKLIELEIE